MDNIISEDDRIKLLSMGLFTKESIDKYGWEGVWRQLRVQQKSKRDKKLIFAMIEDLPNSMNYSYSCMKQHRTIGHKIKGSWDDQTHAMKKAIVRARYGTKVFYHYHLKLHF